SRRRHTRFSRDWSSDVCSSDLLPESPASAVVGTGSRTVEGVEPGGARSADPTGTRIRLLDALSSRSPRTPEQVAALSGLAVDRRPEERRGGKECRARLQTEHAQ